MSSRRGRSRPQVEAAGGRFVDLFGPYPLEAADDESIPVVSRYVTYAAPLRRGRSSATSAGSDVSLVVTDTFAVIGRVVALALGVPYVSVVAGHNLAPGPYIEEVKRTRRRSRRRSAACARSSCCATATGCADASPFSYADGLSPHLNVLCEPPRVAERGRAPGVRAGRVLRLAAARAHARAPRPPAGFRGGSPKVYVSLGTVPWWYWPELVDRRRWRRSRARSAGTADAADQRRRRLRRRRRIASRRMRSAEARGRRRTLHTWAALGEADVFVTSQGANSTPRGGLQPRADAVATRSTATRPGWPSCCAELGIGLSARGRAPRAADRRRRGRGIAAIGERRAAFDEALERARGWELAVIAEPRGGDRARARAGSGVVERCDACLERGDDAGGGGSPEAADVACARTASSPAGPRRRPSSAGSTTSSGSPARTLCANSAARPAVSSMPERVMRRAAAATRGRGGTRRVRSQARCSATARAARSAADQPRDAREPRHRARRRAARTRPGRSCATSRRAGACAAAAAPAARAGRRRAARGTRRRGTRRPAAASAAGSPGSPGGDVKVSAKRAGAAIAGQSASGSGPRRAAAPVETDLVGARARDLARRSASSTRRSCARSAGSTASNGASGACARRRCRSSARRAAGSSSGRRRARRASGRRRGCRRRSRCASHSHARAGSEISFTHTSAARGALRLVAEHGRPAPPQQHLGPRHQALVLRVARRRRRPAVRPAQQPPVRRSGRRSPGCSSVRIQSRLGRSPK